MNRPRTRPAHRTAPRPRGPGGHPPGWLLLLLLTLVPLTLVLDACAARAPETGPAARVPPGSATQAPAQTGAPAPDRPGADRAVPPEPDPGDQGGAVGRDQTGEGALPPPGEGPAFTPYSQDLEDLRREVDLVCASARRGRHKDYLAPLVKELYLSGVDPSDATDALILVNCGPVTDLVQELVAQGGEEVLDLVVERAVALVGSRSEKPIRAAAARGLERNMGLIPEPREPARSVPGPKVGGLSMVYFPYRGAAPIVAQARSAEALFNAATPGYGVYTFVLPGGGLSPARGADRARYNELVRVIETYVPAGEGGGRAPDPQAHVFLVGGRAGGDGLRLGERSGPDPSAAVRQDLIRYLGFHNQPELAERLSRLPGPFLVSGAEPRLVPTSDLAPRLLVDLSGLGTENLFALVDAYDRPLAPGVGGGATLEAIRDRLRGVPVRPAQAGEAAPSSPDAWVFLLGGTAPTGSAPLPTPDPSPGAPPAPGGTATPSQVPAPPGGTGPADSGAIPRPAPLSPPESPAPAGPTGH